MFARPCHDIYPPATCQCRAYDAAAETPRQNGSRFTHSGILIWLEQFSRCGSAPTRHPHAGTIHLIRERLVQPFCLAGGTSERRPSIPVSLACVPRGCYLAACLCLCRNGQLLHESANNVYQQTITTSWNARALPTNLQFLIALSWLRLRALALPALADRRKYASHHANCLCRQRHVAGRCEF